MFHGKWIELWTNVIMPPQLGVWDIKASIACSWVICVVIDEFVLGKFIVDIAGGFVFREFGFLRGYKGIGFESIMD